MTASRERSELARRLIEEMVAEETAFLANCLVFFGLLPGESEPQFKQEVWALTDKDQDELGPLLEAELVEEVREQWSE